MPDDTLIQFGDSEEPAVDAESPVAPVSERVPASVCEVCHQHFSAEAKFCPFDGERLVLAPDWHRTKDALLGTTIDGRYEILSVIGEGGMGTVYAARHSALGRRFALKALRPEFARDAEISARFIQEAQTAAAVSHPGLVEITDFGALPSGQPYFVMEFVEGQTLAALIRVGGPLPARRAVEIVVALAEALGAAHELGIVHRDLKPENIHIRQDDAGRDRVKIVDFGLAKVIGASGLTRAGMVFGTPHYMSPEQAAGDATDHRADVYALGVVMYEMFTGRVPFEADSYMGVLTKHMYMAPTPPSRLPGTQRLGALEELLLRCLEKKPSNRYASMRELTQDLERIMKLTVSQGALRLGGRVRGVLRSVLADELEVPTLDELSIAERRVGLPLRSWWPLVGVGMAFVLGLGLFLALRRPNPALGRGASSAAQVKPIARAMTRPLVSGPQVIPIPDLIFPPAVPNSASPVAVPLPAPVPAPATKPAQAPPNEAPRALSPARPAAKLRRLGNGEIIDPWAR